MGNAKSKNLELQLYCIRIYSGRHNVTGKVSGRGVANPAARQAPASATWRVPFGDRERRGVAASRWACRTWSFAHG